MPVISSQQAAPAVVDSAMKRAQALRLRAQGKTYERIAEILGVARQTAHTLVIRGLAETREQFAESAADVRSMELVRLDLIYKKLAEKFEHPECPDPAKIAASMLRVMERRAKYLGLDAPTDLRLGGIPGGDAIPVAGDINLRNLSIEQLHQLAALVSAASSQPPRVVAPAPPQLPPSTNGNHP